MRRALRSFTLLACVALTFAVAACGQGDDDAGGSGPSGEDGGTVGISMPDKTTQRWIDDGNNMVKEFEAKGFETDLQFAQEDVQQQISQIENMITRGVDALVIAAVDGSALTDVLQKAKDADIPVIAYDRLIRETSNVDYYATFDNFKVGEVQAGYIVEKLGLESGETGPFNIELFAGSPDDNNATVFFEGAVDVLQPHIDTGALVVKSGQTSFKQVATPGWDANKAQDRMENLLSSEYTRDKLDAVLSPYDGISIGIISALKSVGYGGQGKPLPIVTGQDAEKASMKSIIAGEQTQTVFKDTRKLAKQAVAMTEAVLKGKKPEVNDTESYDNGVKVVPAYLLEPENVDKSNYNAVLIDSGYYTESDVGG